MSLLIVGSVAFDQVETPFGKTGKILGGAGTYFCLAAGLFTKHLNLVSVVGDDFPQAYEELLRNRHVDLCGLKRVKGQKTFFWAGKYHQDMNMRDTLATDLNVLAGFDPVLPLPYRRSPYVMLGNLTPSVQMRVIEQMEVRPELICMDTMNFWMNTAWDDLLAVIKKVDVLAINDQEAKQLSGKGTLPEAARTILSMGPRILIVKKGEHGSMLFTAERTFVIPALLLEQVKDPTGAGDSFAGGFMGYIASRKDTGFDTLKKALVYATVTASFTVEDFGTDKLAGVSRKDLDERYAAFLEMTSVCL